MVYLNLVTSLETILDPEKDIYLFDINIEGKLVETTGFAKIWRIVIHFLFQCCELYSNENAKHTLLHRAITLTPSSERPLPFDCINSSNSIEKRIASLKDFLFNKTRACQISHVVEPSSKTPPSELPTSSKTDTQNNETVPPITPAAPVIVPPPPAPPSVKILKSESPSEIDPDHWKPENYEHNAHIISNANVGFFDSDPTGITLQGTLNGRTWTWNAKQIVSEFNQLFANVKGPWNVLEPTHSSTSMKTRYELEKSLRHTFAIHIKYLFVARNIKRLNALLAKKREKLEIVDINRSNEAIVASLVSLLESHLKNEVRFKDLATPLDGQSFAERLKGTLEKFIAGEGPLEDYIGIGKTNFSINELYNDLYQVDPRPGVRPEFADDERFEGEYPDYQFIHGYRLDAKNTPNTFCILKRFSRYDSAQSRRDFWSHENYAENPHVISNANVKFLDADPTNPGITIACELNGKRWLWNAKDVVRQFNHIFEHHRCNWHASGRETSPKNSLRLHLGIFLKYLIVLRNMKAFNRLLEQRSKSLKELHIWDSNRHPQAQIEIFVEKIEENFKGKVVFRTPPASSDQPFAKRLESAIKEYINSDKPIQDFFEIEEEDFRLDQLYRSDPTPSDFKLEIDKKYEEACAGYYNGTTFIHGYRLDKDAVPHPATMTKILSE